MNFKKKTSLNDSLLHNNNNNNNNKYNSYCRHLVSSIQ